ncbi:MAG: EF-hand domain-containing protein [Acidobacteria bacterium]|nr:EF-hand domain-containing protein [Acidobacteriota bacterium]
MKNKPRSRMILLLGLTFTFIIAVSILLMAAPRSAAHKRGFTEPARMMERLDTDGDGLISMAEFTHPPDLFDRLDLNEDGNITREETEQARRQHQAEMAELAAERFREADTDQNGYLSPDEFPGFDRAFERLDADNDGQLSPEELAAGRPGNRGGRMERGQHGPGFGGGFGPAGEMDREEIFRKMDLNQDGFLNLDELTATRENMRERSRERMERFDPEERFKELDVNGDGLLSTEEFHHPMNNRFQRLDTDGDGMISLDEFRQGKPERRGDRLNRRAF